MNYFILLLFRDQLSYPLSKIVFIKRNAQFDTKIVALGEVKHVDVCEKFVFLVA